jgi:glycerate-2-kinase
MQLLGEEINTQVSVLACGRRGGDTDDLAWTTLEDQEIAETDVMAGDSDGVGGVGGLSGGGGGASTARYELGSVSSTSIFIVITHLVVGGGERILDNLVGVLD